MKMETIFAFSVFHFSSHVNCSVFVPHNERFSILANWNVFIFILYRCIHIHICTRTYEHIYLSIYPNNVDCYAHIAFSAQPSIFIFFFASSSTKRENSSAENKRSEIFYYYYMISNSWIYGYILSRIHIQYAIKGVYVRVGNSCNVYYYYIFYMLLCIRL